MEGNKGPQRRSINTTGVTLDDIAAQCGVHRMTVSRALRGFPHIKAETRARILQMADALGYDPSQHEGARRLALRRHDKDVLNRVVALSMPYPGALSISYFSMLFDGILETLLDRDYSALMLSFDRKLLTRDTLPLPFHRGDVDALIGIMAPLFFSPLVTRLRQLPSFDRRPIVSLMENIPDASFVGADDERGAYAATSHLLALGHRHLLQFYDPTSPHRDVSTRLAGATQAFRAAGLDPALYLHRYALPLIDGFWLGSEQISFDDMPPGEYEARQALAAYLTAHPEITAILAQNDANARHAWYVLNALHRRVPEQMSLIGFDDTLPILDEQGRNLLTSVRLPLREIGQAAGHCILRHLEDPELPDEEIILPPTLVLRASTGPAPVR